MKNDYKQHLFYFLLELISTYCKARSPLAPWLLDDHSSTTMYSSYFKNDTKISNFDIFSPIYSKVKNNYF